ncbi:MAG: hypothetical protein M3277_06520 [Actinomycetota bacterium]|nr:hypothetical protein [Actinomycetota bacterium]
MPRTLRLLVCTLVSIGLLGIPVPPGGASDLTPANVDRLKHGAMKLADWLDSLRDEGHLGRRVPLLGTKLGAALHIGAQPNPAPAPATPGVFDHALKTPLSSIDPGTNTVQELADAIAGYSGTKTLDGHQLAVTFTVDPSSVDDLTPAGDTITGFDLVARVERTIAAAPLAVSVATPELTLTSVDSSGVPVELAFEATFQLRHNSVGDYFFVAASDGGTSGDDYAAVANDTPRITATAQSLTSPSGAAGSYTIPPAGFKSAIGFGDLTLDQDTPSTFFLDASYVGDVIDSNGDGILAFQEPGNPGELIDAELTLPRSNNFRTFRQGTATTSIAVDSPFTDADDDAVIAVAGASNLSGGDPTPTASGTAVEMLDDFENVSAVDVLGGLVQYATLLRGVQTHPDIDFDLPMASGRFSDVFEIQGELKTFIDARVVSLPPGQIPDSADDLVDFETALALAEKMSNNSATSGIPSLQDTNDAGTGDITPSYNAATQQLTFDIHVHKTVTDYEDIPEPATEGAVPIDQRSEVGIPEFGDVLRPTTGLAGGALPDNNTSDTLTNGASQATRKYEYEYDIPFVIDLSDASTAGADGADDPDTEGIVEFEDPMPFERFLVPTAGTNEIDLSADVRTPISIEGQAGFVKTRINGTSGADSYHFYPNSSAPVLTVDLNSVTAGLDATPRLTDLLDDLQHDDGNPDPVGDPTELARLDLRFDMEPFSDEGYSMTAGNRGGVTVDWTNVAQPLENTMVTLTNDTARMIKAFDIVPDGDPGALLTKLVDKVQNAANRVDERLDEIPEFNGFDIVDTDIPLLGSSINDLFRKVTQVTEGGTTRAVSLATLVSEKLDRLRSGDLPFNLQALETALQSELGIPDNALNFSLKDFGSDPTSPELVFRLHLQRNINEQIPINVDLDFGNIVGANSTGDLNLTGSGVLDLNVPITLSAPTAADLTGPVDVLNSSGVSLDLNVQGSPQLTASLGPLQLQVGDNTRSQIKMGGGFTAFAGPDGAPVSEGAEAPVPFDDFIGALSPRFNPGSGSPFNCNPPATNEEAPNPPEIQGTIACATLPVYLNNTPVSGDVDSSYLTVAVNGLDPSVSGNVAIAAPSGLETAVLNDILNITSMKDGLAKLRAILDLALQGTTYGAELPLVGDKIAAGAKAIEKFQGFVDALVTPTLESPTLDLANVSEQIRASIEEALPAGILRESGYAATGAYYAGNTSPTADEEDIRVVMLCGGSNCLPGTTLADLDEVTVEFELGQGNAAVASGDCTGGGSGTPCEANDPITIDLGLPGINFGTAGGGQQVQPSAGWSLQLGFGVSREDGFFILDNPMPASGTPDNYGSETEQELKVGFGVGMTQNPSADELSVQLGFLDFGLEDQPGLRNSSSEENHASRLDARVTADLRVPNGAATCTPGLLPPNQTCSDKLTADQLLGAQVTELLNPLIAAEADLDFTLTSGIEGTVGHKLPKVRADLRLNWQLGQPGAPAPGDPDCTGEDGDGGNTSDPSVGITDVGTPAVCFENLGIDPGTLFQETLRPIFNEIKALAKPVDPIREFIFSPVPVLSDASRLFGGDDITYVDLAALFGDFDPRLLEDINALIASIQSFPTATGEYLAIGDGEFKLSGSRAVESAITPDQARTLIRDADLEMSAAKSPSILGDAKSRIATNQDSKDKFDAAIANDGSPDLTFPILQEPACVMQMLFGGDCGLIEWNPEPLRLDFSFEQAIGPFFGVVYVTFGGFAGAQARLSLGYDTRGFRELFEGGVANAGPGKLLNGIYINDLAPDGSDPAELEVWAGVTAGAKLSIVVAEAGARGGVQATVGLNWHDGPEVDGKLRINEIISKIHVPFCLFDVQGRLEAFLEVYLTLGVCPFCAEYSQELARVVLLDFSEGFCPNTVPNLADNTADDVVHIHAGVDAGLRGGTWGDPNVVGHDENFVIKELTPPGTSPKRFSITAFGHTEEATGQRIQINDAGEGDDVFVFQGTKVGAEGGEAPAETAGEAPFSANVTATLGTGNDSISTGDGVDVVNGGEGNDMITTGFGADQITAGPLFVSGDITDNDTVTAGPGNDNPVDGGAGNDTIDGGLGADTISGGFGDDRIDGGRDVVVKLGVSTPCASVPAGAPCDTFDTGDDIAGGIGDDQIDGGNGADTIYGDERNANLATDIDGFCFIFCGGDDVITGGLGGDHIYGARGADEINGGVEDPLVDTSVDDIHGNGGEDEIFGAAGADLLYGGSGNDTITGQTGDDDIYGQGNADTAFGNEGTDDIYGGDGDDELFGNANDDNLFGEGDSDSLFGDVGDDDLDGGAGNDRQDDGGGLFGNDGADDIKGGAGMDDLFGGVGIDFMMGDDGGINDSDPSNRVGTPLESSGENDRLFGENAADVMWGEGGNDELQGGPSGDLMFGNNGDDTMLGQTGLDRMIGGSARDDASDTGDHMYGGTEEDTMIGDNGVINSVVLGPTGLAGTFGDDTMNGGPNADLMYGQEGNDTMYGAEDFDRMFGNLGGDFMYGQDGPDYMLGDSGTISESAAAEGPAIWPGGAPNRDVVLGLGSDTDETPNHGGIDTMDGGTADDHMWGGAANDIMSGGFDDDYMEGNNGQDRMFGASTTADDGIEQASDGLDDLFDGEDDMIGGSSAANPLTATPAGADDEGETEMFGNGQEDVMTGDNANITRLTNEAGTEWAIDIVTLGIARDVELLDTEKTGPALLPVSGDDTMFGNDERDRMYGEAGNDCEKGNNDEDYVEGNQDTDVLEGNDGQDDLIGGSALAGQPDDVDLLYGGDDADIGMGDNAIVTRLVGQDPVTGNSPVIQETPYVFETNRLEIPTQREIRPLDLASYLADSAGADRISGGSGSDVLFGQDENDTITGNSNDDYMEGNGHTDRLYGDAFVIGPEGCASSDTFQLYGEHGAGSFDGQDDQIGGSSIKGHRDANDFLYGNGEQDFQLGDNGYLFRTVVDATITNAGGYRHYDDANDLTITRRAVRFDVGVPETDGVWGDDYFEGHTGDDYQYGQDGDDEMYGNEHNDDMFGELGDDRMFGQTGEDAMLGDRGTITDDRIVATTQSSSCTPISSPSCDPASFTIATKGPPFITFTAFRPDTLDRRFDLRNDGDGDVDGDGNPIESPGHDVGGQDFMRGGPDHDSMHGADGDDIMNGDSFGDILYGDDGADALWGGKGSDDQSNLSSRGTDPACASGPGGNCTDDYLDYVFGGHGGDPNQNQGVITGGADVIDFRPRPDGDPTTSGAQPDPALWFEITDTDDDVGGPDDPSHLNNQHHQGIDWIYGGWDRDVMQSNVSANGPNDGDRLMDWDGAYNLYTHCNPAYGGYNDLRALSPTMIGFLESFAFATGVGTTVANVQDSASSAYREVAIVYRPDLKHNSGKAYPTTPGHFDSFSCAP